MKFSLFRKPKQPTEPEKPAEPPQDEPKQELAGTPVEPTPIPEASQSAQATVEPAEEPKQEAAEPTGKTYLKAMPLKDLADVEKVKDEVNKGNIIILRVTPLASKSVDDVKTAVNELYQFSESTGGDIARLGEERVVICPKSVRIWREKTPAPTDDLPTAAPTAA